MRSAIGDELEKREKRIKTFNLDDIIPNSDDFTYADTITYENLRYINYESRDEDMNIKYNIEFPDKSTLYPRRAEETIAIEEFLQDPDKENMCFEYEDVKKAESKANTVCKHRKRKKLEKLYNFYRVKNCIYIKKTEKCKQILQSRSKTNEKKK